MIILYHFSEGHHYTGLLWFDRIAARGYLWVEFFFVLAGFILAHAYGQRLKDLLQWRGYGAFLRARLIRLYPLHLFMLLLILVLVIIFRALAAAGGYVSLYDLPWHQDVSAKGFELSLFLVQAWHTMDRLTWNGLSWFVSVEFALRLLFPALLYLSHGRACRGVALIAAGVAGLLALPFTSGHGLDITYDWGVVRGVCDFIIGIGMAVLFREVKDQRIPVWVHTAIQILLVLLLAYAVTYTGWAHTRNDILTALPLIALIFALAFDVRRDGAGDENPHTADAGRMVLCHLSGTEHLADTAAVRQAAAVSAAGHHRAGHAVQRPDVGAETIGAGDHLRALGRPADDIRGIPGRRRNCANGWAAALTSRTSRPHRTPSDRNRSEAIRTIKKPGGFPWPSPSRTRSSSSPVPAVVWGERMRWNLPAWAPRW